MNWKNIRLGFTLLSLLALIISFAVSGFWVIRAYTIQTNLLVFIWLALAYYYNDLDTPDAHMQKLKGWVRTGITMYITVTFVIFVLLLQSIYHPTGLNIFTNIVHHYIIPIFFIIDWVLYEREPLEYKHVLYWLIFPLLYLFMTIVYGTLTHSYIYPFLNLNIQSPLEFTAWVFILLAVFITFGSVMVLLRKKYLR